MESAFKAQHSGAGAASTRHTLTAPPHSGDTRRPSRIAAHPPAPAHSCPLVHMHYTPGGAQPWGNGAHMAGAAGCGNRHAPAVGSHTPSVGYFMAGSVSSEQRRDIECQ